MKKFLIGAIAALLSITAYAATLAPVQLLNPVGSTAGQAIVSAGPSSAPAWGSVAATALAPVAANTVIANATGSTAAPTAFAVPSCSTSASALNWTSGSGLTCNTTVNAAQLGGATFAAPGSIGSTTPGSGAFTAITATGTITPSQTNGIVGTTTSNNANAGSVGELLSNTTLATNLPTNTGTNATSVSLTAGDWDCGGTIGFNPAGGTTLSNVQAGITTTSATIPTTIGTRTIDGNTKAAGATVTIPTPIVRMSLSGTTTVYLVAFAGVAASTATVDGFLRCRRPR